MEDWGQVVRWTHQRLKPIVPVALANPIGRHPWLDTRRQASTVCIPLLIRFLPALVQFGQLQELTVFRWTTTPRWLVAGNSLSPTFPVQTRLPAWTIWTRWTRGTLGSLPRLSEISFESMYWSDSPASYTGETYSHNGLDRLSLSVFNPSSIRRLR